MSINILKPIYIERAISYGLLISVFQVISAPITMLLLTRYLSAEAQGYYYMFFSLIALKSFVELGLFVVILNVASHEWAKLSIDSAGKIVGDSVALSRLISLGRFVFKWYLGGAIVFVMLIGMLGQSILAGGSNDNIAWLGPWWSMIGISCMLMMCLPYSALLEGCNQVKTVQLFRLFEVFLRNITLWASLYLELNLWVLIISALSSLGVYLCLFGVRYRNFFNSFLNNQSGPKIDWANEIFPMQWRLAVSGIFSYLLSQIFTPVMFHYHGSAEAGKMGMTMAVVSAIQGISMNWLIPQTPKFGMLIANKDFRGLDILWQKTLKASLVVSCLGASSAWLLIYMLNAFDYGLAQRLLPPATSAIFLITIISITICNCQTAYLRAHKKERLMGLSVVTSLLMGGGVWALGSNFGAFGAALSYFIVLSVISLPWQTYIFIKSRREWH